MKIVFFGTPEYVLPVLRAIYKHHEVVAVVTQPPKPSGRKGQLTYSSVDTWAHKHNVPIFFSSQKFLESGLEADLGILASYGKIVNKKVINFFPQGIINIHPSLLPKYRGASPVQQAILDGLEKTGVTVMLLDEELDHGPIISQFKEDINPNDTTQSLRNRLFERSAKFLIDLIPNYLNKKINIKKQKHIEATYTKQLTKEDGFIGLTKTDPKKADCFIRAMTPWPGSWTYVQLEQTTKNIEHRKRLKLLKAHLEENKLVLDEVQLEGKTPVSWEQFKQGYPTNSLAGF